MSKELNPSWWVCDHCKDIIENVNQGWLEWVAISNNNKIFYSNFRIVHHKHFSSIGSCYYDDYMKLKKGLMYGMHLNRFHGKAGMNVLISILDENPNIDRKDFIKVFRRLYFPYYEEALQYWEDAERDNYFYDLNIVQLYTENFLKTLIKKYKHEEINYEMVLGEIYNNSQDELNAWDKKFISNVYNWYLVKNNFLSEKQKETIIKIKEKYIPDF